MICQKSQHKHKKMKYCLLILIAIFLQNCTNPNAQNRTLPKIGFADTDPVTGDTIYPKIRDFEFMNQDSQKVTNATFEGKIYIADFFFISCPTICPKLTKQMLRIYTEFEEDDRLLMLSHTVDPKHDTIPRLKNYARNLGVSSEKWHMVRGDADFTYDIADDYFSVAHENPDAPGGYDHSGRIILVDKNRHIRSFCNGTDPGDVDRFMEDIKLLMNEK